MKARVIMPFNDKETGKLRKVGEEIEVTPTRFKEIRKAGNFVAKVDKADQEENQEKPEKAKRK